MKLVSVVPSNQSESMIEHQLELFADVTRPSEVFSGESDLYGSAFMFLERANRFVRGRDTKALSSQGGLSIINRSMEYNGVQYDVEIRPARLFQKDESGSTITVDCYPGDREELVERAIIRIASAQQAMFASRDISGKPLHFVKTSIRSIRRELKLLGYTINHADCKEAIDILSGASIKVTSRSTAQDDNVYEIKGPVFPQVIFSESNSGSERTQIQLSAFHSYAIVRGDYQRYLLSRTASHKQSFLRWLDTTLSLFWRAPSSSTLLTVSLIDFMSQYGVVPGTKRLETLRRDMKSALNTLLHANVIANNPIARRVPYTNGFFFSYPDDQRPDVESDFLYDLVPHQKFASFSKLSAQEREDRMARIAALQDVYHSIGDSEDDDV